MELNNQPRTGPSPTGTGAILTGEFANNQPDIRTMLNPAPPKPPTVSFPRLRFDENHPAGFWNAEDVAYALGRFGEGRAEGEAPRAQEHPDDLAKAGRSAAKPAEELPLKKRRGRKGKQVETRERPEPATYSGEVVSNPKSCLVRDLSKVQRYARECPPPDLEASARASGLRDSKRDARGWRAPSSSVPQGSPGQSTSGSTSSGLRPGRWFTDLPPEPAECASARQLAQLRLQGGHLPDEHGSNGGAPDAGISEEEAVVTMAEAPEVADDGEEDCKFQISLYESSISISMLSLSIKF